MKTCKTSIILSKEAATDPCCLAMTFLQPSTEQKRGSQASSSVEREEDLQNLKLPFKEAIAFVQLVHILVALQLLFCSQPQI